MEAFPPDDHASGLHNLDLNKRPVSMQQSLGVYRDLKLDSFTLILRAARRIPCTRQLRSCVGYQQPVRSPGPFSTSHH